MLVFVLYTVLQPVVVVSAHGAGRAGCLCAVAVAHELMTARQENPDCWTKDGHILDEVHLCDQKLKHNIQYPHLASFLGCPC